MTACAPTRVPSHAPVRLRPARLSDLQGIRALMGPEVAAGNLLPKRVDPADFLVATRGREVVGCVALTPWAPNVPAGVEPLPSPVVELGALVASERGRGLGRQLVDAALDWATRRGARDVVALTNVPGFFERVGFRAVAEAPWMIARRHAGLPTPTGLSSGLPDAPLLRAATAHKALGTCASCPRLAGCRQVLLVRPLVATRQRRARA